MSDENIEKRTYSLHWTHASGEARRAEIDVTIYLDYERSSAYRVRACSTRKGYVWAATTYVAVMRMACEVLRRENVATFRIERDGDEFPAMAPPCESFDGEKKYVVNWYNEDHRECRASMTVHRNRSTAIYQYGTFAGVAASPMIALYGAACEVAGGNGTFYVTEAS